MPQITCYSYEQVHPAVHRLHLKRHSHIPFAPPPLPGTATIQPIRTLSELFSEGRKMQNCVYGFQQAIQEGRVYFYRVKRPKCRATLMLEKDRDDGFWRATELRAWQNGQPSEQCVEEVMLYLTQSYPLVDMKQLNELPPIDQDDWWDEDGDFSPPKRHEDEEPGAWDFPQEEGF